MHSEVADDLRLADGTVVNDESEPGDIPMLLTVPMSNLPCSATISRDFIRGVIKFGPSCPADVVDKAISLVIAHWSQFSWHEMDLGCITDVPYDTKYTDHSPCGCQSRRHNYSEHNAPIIEAKSRPLIDLGVYKTAGPDVVDRAQLVAVCTNPKVPMNLKFYWVAPDFRCKNDKAFVVPVPMATRLELYSFLTQFKYF